MYDRKSIISYLESYGWTENRHISTLDIPKLYSHFFDNFEDDEELALDMFISYTPFPKLMEFWALYGNLDLKFSASSTNDNRGGVIAINKNAIVDCPDYSVVQTSIHYSVQVFPVAVVEAYQCYITIDVNGHFRGLNYDGSVCDFSDDFLEVIDLFINHKPMPEWEYFSKHE